MATRSRKATKKSASGAKQGPIGNTSGVYIPVPKPNTSGGVTKIPIEATTPEEKSFLEQKQDQLQGKIDDWVAAQGDSKMAMAGGALATALNQVLFPTSVWELIPAGKVFKLAKKGKEAAQAALKAKTAEKAAEQAADAKKAADAGKQAERSKDAKKAGDKDGGRVDPKKQKPHKECGKVAKHKDNYKEKGVMNSDHVPSGAALKKAAERQLRDLGLLRKLSPKELKSVLNSVYNNATTISVPEDVHKEGRTWGPRNKPHIDGDSKRSDTLKDAFKKDTDKIQESMDAKDHGCSDKYREAVKQMESIDFEAEVEKAVKAHKAVIKRLPK